MRISYLSFWTAKDDESQAEAYDANLKEILSLDGMGWDSVWLGGVPLMGMLPDPLLLCAAIAARTEEIKIGTAVHLPGLKTASSELTADIKEGGSTINRRGTTLDRFAWAFNHYTPANPLQTAEQIAMLDQLSNGRFIYGAGGDTAGDEVRLRHFHEYLNVLRQALTEKQFSGFEGEFYSYKALPANSQFMPRCVQQPHPPILLPIDSQQSFEPMGRLGYRIAIGGGSMHNERGDAVLKDDVKRYRQAWRQAEHEGEPSVTVRMSTFVASTQQEANRVRKASEKKQVDYLTERGQSQQKARSPDLFGTAEEVVDRILQLQEDFGADEIMCAMLGWRSSREDVAKCIRLISEKVIPKVI